MCSRYDTDNVSLSIATTKKVYPANRISVFSSFQLTTPFSGDEIDIDDLESPPSDAEGQFPMVKLDSHSEPQLKGTAALIWLPVGWHC